MKSPRHPALQLAAISMVVFLSTIHTRTLDAAVTLDGGDAFVKTSTPSGDLTVTGDLSILKGIDFGTAATNPALSAVQINWFGGGENAAKIDLTDPLGTMQWRDNLAAAPRDKMKLNGTNLLTLYKCDGTGAGILLNPNTSQIQLTGTGAGIYADGNPVFTIGSSGNLAFGNRPLSLGNTTASGSSSTGALTVAGGIGVAMDSWINGIRVGRGGGNVTTNTACGTSTLQRNTTGGCATAMGYFALYGNTTGYYNTASGAYSMYGNSTGYYNTASGAYSLYSNTTGSSNTSCGYLSLYSNSNGGSNTSVGYYALGHNLSGSSNTAIGAYSLGCISTGSFNVAIGPYAGYYQANGTSMTAMNNSVYIGANARGFSNLEQNSIVIGFKAAGEGSNTTVIGNNYTTKTHIYGTVNASGFVSNNQPVLTPSFGSYSTLSNNAVLAIGNSASATQPGSIAIGRSTQALGYDSVALGDASTCTVTSNDSMALMGGITTRPFSFAAAYGEADGDMSIAVGFGLATGNGSIAFGGIDCLNGNWSANHSAGENSVTLGGVGNQALGFSSYASGFWTTASASYALALGSLNLGSGTSADSWVETDTLLELGNGNAPRSWEEPAAVNRSNAITTLKNGQTTLTNKAWKANAAAPLADPGPDASGGEALVVEGHTRLKGKVIIEQVQGDISMGIYGP